MSFAILPFEGVFGTYPGQIAAEFLAGARGHFTIIQTFNSFDQNTLVWVKHTVG